MKKSLFIVFFAISAFVAQARDCRYLWQIWPDGSVICINNWEHRCDDGFWAYLGTPCGRQITIDETTEKNSSPIRTVVLSDASTASTSTDKDVLPCISMFFLGSFRVVGLRNYCAECKVAVIMWTGVGERLHRVNGYSSITIDIPSSNGQIIGENPCK
jgi:hypothetical protein